ncbi:hypothetical protein Nepgr_015397 [Nepenthes gracilis]|uniref:Uncharacterized protein n=1 Tax=Nepenthes gracilis TaxID=150966 RepID=A0AAD3SNK6_NEPGR|nr:hypothetical protein Nepgr_015397 [Nepenthes gracilis]
MGTLIPNSVEISNVAKEVLKKTCPCCHPMVKAFLLILPLIVVNRELTIYVVPGLTGSGFSPLGSYYDWRGLSESVLAQVLPASGCG